VEDSRLGSRAFGAPGLRLAWHNPAAVAPGEPPSSGLRLVPPPTLPSRPVKLDLAIERHLSGADGLPREEFLVMFSGRATRAPAPALS
jgi:hypothetical protein